MVTVAHLLKPREQESFLRAYAMPLPGVLKVTGQSGASYTPDGVDEVVPPKLMVPPVTVLVGAAMYR